MFQITYSDLVPVIGSGPDSRIVPAARPVAPAPDLRCRLQRAGLHITAPRLHLAGLLLTGRPRHVTAGALRCEAAAAGLRMSLATVYNTLNQFADAGLLRRLAVSREQVYFDTRVDPHHHFYVDAEQRIFDVPGGGIVFGRLPDPPAGYVISRIDVVIRLKRIGTP